MAGVGMVSPVNSAVPLFFFSSRRRHTRYWRDWSSDVCSSDLRCRILVPRLQAFEVQDGQSSQRADDAGRLRVHGCIEGAGEARQVQVQVAQGDRKSVVEGKSVDLGGRRILKKKHTT